MTHEAPSPECCPSLFGEGGWKPLVVSFDRACESVLFLGWLRGSGGSELMLLPSPN